MVQTLIFYFKIKFCVMFLDWKKTLCSYYQFILLNFQKLFGYLLSLYIIFVNFQKLFGYSLAEFYITPTGMWTKDQGTWEPFKMKKKKGNFIFINHYTVERH